MSKDNSANLIRMQHQIRNNAQEYTEFVNDLQKWTKEISVKDKKLQEGNAKKNYPPVRGTESSAATQEKIEPQLDPDEQAEKAKETGNDYFKKGDVNKAIEFYTKSLLFKQDAIVYSNRSQAYFKLANFKESELDATRSISLNSSYVKSYMRRGMARRELKKYKESKDDFEYARKLNPNHVETERELLKAIELLKKSEQGKATKVVIEEDEDEETPKQAVPVVEKQKEPIVTKPSTPVETPKQTVPIEKPQEAAVTKPVVLEEKKPVQPTPVVEDEIEDLITTGASKNIQQGVSKKPEVQQPKMQPKVEPKEEPKVVVEPIKQAEQKPVIAETVTKVEQPKVEYQPTVKISIKPTVPQSAPKSFYEFEKYVRELQGEDFANYLKVIPPTRLHSVLHNSLSPEIFMSIISSIHTYFLSKPFKKENVENAFELLQKLSEVNRFEMTIMFMESSEIQIVKALFDLFYEYKGIEAHKIDSLRSKYIEQL